MTECINCRETVPDAGLWLGENVGPFCAECQGYAFQQLQERIEQRITEIGIDSPRDWEVDPHKRYDYDMEEAAAINELRCVLAILNSQQEKR